MTVEIEAKLKVDSHDAVRDRLSALGATRIGRVLEENHIFDSTDRAMLKADCGLRVRLCFSDTGRPVSTTMTYKGAQTEGLFKSRPEIQLHVDDGAAAMEFLSALGFIRAITFQKHRESWQLGDCRVELDELPHLGSYVEIEGPDESAVASTQQALDLGHLPHEPRSYIAMLVHYCRQHNRPATSITFSEK